MVIFASIAIVGRIGSFSSARRAPLISLAVQEEIAKNPTGTPEEAIGPSFDTTLVFIEDKNGA
jgi:hypothetical protein